MNGNFKPPKGWYFGGQGVNPVNTGWLVISKPRRGWHYYQSHMYCSLYSSPYASRNLRYSSLKDILWWCSSWFNIYFRTVSICDWLTEKAPKPFCQLKWNCDMRLSLIHLDVFDLTNLTASDNAIFRDKINNIWIWFCIPPTHIVGQSLCDKTPEI